MLWGHVREGYTAASLLNLSTGWRWVISLTDRLCSPLLFPLDMGLGGPCDRWRRFGDSRILLHLPGIRSCFLSHPDSYFIHCTIWTILDPSNIPNLKKFTIPGKSYAAIRTLYIRRIWSLEARYAFILTEMNPAVPTQSSLHCRLLLDILFLFVTASNSYYWNTWWHNSKNQHLSVF
jgi:hypothetical protein